MLLAGVRACIGSWLSLLAATSTALLHLGLGPTMLRAAIPALHHFAALFAASGRPVCLLASDGRDRHHKNRQTNQAFSYQ